MTVFTFALLLIYLSAELVSFAHVVQQHQSRRTDHYLFYTRKKTSFVYSSIPSLLMYPKETGISGRVESLPKQSY